MTQSGENRQFLVNLIIEFLLYSTRASIREFTLYGIQMRISNLRYFVFLALFCFMIVQYFKLKLEVVESTQVEGLKKKT